MIKEKDNLYYSIDEILNMVRAVKRVAQEYGMDASPVDIVERFFAIDSVATLCDVDFETAYKEVNKVFGRNSVCRE